MKWLKRFRDWLRYRNVSHFEIRWRPPNGRGWRQVDDETDGFDPSALDTPMSEERFRMHAPTANYYQGEYRLIAFDEQGRMGQTVWQTWFKDGPSLQEEQRRERKRQERKQELLRVTEQLLEEISSSDRY